MPLRLIVAVALTAAGVAAAGCGADDGAGSPTSPPPTITAVDSVPPPAWVETRSGRRWLAFSDFCWFTACIDFRQPAERNDVPVVRVESGETIRFHLGFEPESVAIQVASARYALKAAEVPEWRVRGRGGFATLETTGGKGRAKYLARLRVAAIPPR